ncbi:hypothetical protein [Bradyrhizobium sp. dw_78]|uniref:hypothetical protein n=1 Tax=Bradyrhizobium sp. dw_78 TaxID=2719793 RepID=UPI001BD6568B|nr:hypothetical protein [Bradyrhizobium sp. dw_78]
MALNPAQADDDSALPDGNADDANANLAVASTPPGSATTDPRDERLPPHIQMAAAMGMDVEQGQKLHRWAYADNIADEIDESLLGAIGMRVVREYEIDNDSRSEWVTKTKRAIELATQKTTPKTYPWPKAANVILPMITSASNQFAARAYPAIVDGRDIVKGIVIGDDSGTPMVNPQTGQPVIVAGPNGQPMPQWAVAPGAKQARADRIGDHMSWQLLDEMPEWEPDTDKLLHMLPTMGCVFRKTFFDPTKGRNCSHVRSALKVVMNYHAKDCETAPRVTEEIEYYPREIEEMRRAGIFRVPENGFAASVNAENASDDPDAPIDFLEQHRWLDLDEDGLDEPYIVTVHKDSAYVARIKARYEPEGIIYSSAPHRLMKIEPVHYYTQYIFLPNPDGGSYGLGFGQLLGPINESANTVINMLLDAGTLQNAGGGFLGKGFSTNTGAVRFSLGEWKPVNVTGGNLRDNIVPFPAPGPSQVLFQLLGLLVESAKEIASVKDVLTGDQQQSNVPATTTLAMIEQGLKTFTAIFKRVHLALKHELAKLYRLNGIYLNQSTQYRVGSEWRTITRADYAQGDGVEPVSDPTMVTDMQRMGRAQLLMSMFANDPYCDGLEIRHRVLEAANIDGIDKILHAPPPNPELIEKAGQLHIKANREQAASLKDLAQAVLFFAQADKAVGDKNLAWVEHQLEIFKTQIEAMQNAGNGNDPGSSGPQSGSGNSGGPPQPVSGMAA